MIRLETNLPERTYATVTFRNDGAGGSGYRCCPEVHDGSLTVTVNDQSCYALVGMPRSSGFEVTITVVPDSAPLQFECLDPNGCSNPQPTSVQEVLGPKFEHLTGDQATMVQGMRALVATARFEWPADACESHLRSGDFMPATCAPGYSDISDDSTRTAAGNLIGAFQQLRLCELYDDGTDEFRADHPWPAFRDRLRALLDDLGPLVEADGAMHLRSEVVEQSTDTFEGEGKTLPRSFVADYFYDGRRVAEAEFVLAGSAAPNVVPRWEFVRLNLM